MLNRIGKLMIIVALTTSMLTTFNVSAKSESNLTDINRIGKHSALLMTEHQEIKWDDVTIIKNKPLYSFDGKLIAYCLDLKNNRTNEKGYIIISNEEEDEPIIEFSTGKYSPYTELKTNEKDTYIYDGVLSYYSKNSKIVYKNIKINIDLKDDEVASLVKASKNKVYKSANPDKAKKTREILSSEKMDEKATSSISSLTATSVAASTSKIISGVADYDWRKGCSPTSAAMILNYHYPTTLPKGNTLIDELAVAMKTDSNGGTNRSDIPIGVKKVGTNHNLYISSWLDGEGRSYSTFC